MKFQIIKILLLVLVSSVFIITPHDAQAAPCELAMTLTENGSPVSAPSVKISDYPKFGLRVTVSSGCVVEHQLRYRFSVDGGQEAELRSDQTVGTGGGVTNIKFGQPAASTIKYKVSMSSHSIPSQRFVFPYDTTVTSKELTVQWTSTTTMPPVSNPPTKTPGGGTGGTGGTNTTPPPTPVDTSVGVKSGDFDQVLGTLFNPLEGGTTVPSLIVRAINILLMLVGLLSVLFIIIGGFQMVTAAGNETTVAKGKKTVTYAIAGLVVSILSFSIVAIIQSIIS